jgi:hypothetical protein
VKIDKTILMETYTHEKWLQLFKECHNYWWKDRKEFICVYYHYKMKSKMRINEHGKKGCDKVVDSKGNPFKLKLYTLLWNTMKCVHLANGGNILEYRAKTFALSKLRSSWPSITLAL